MIEHFSKWLVLVSLPDCGYEKTTYAFLDRVFNKFGVLVEVLNDQDLCEKALIDHRTTS